MKILLSLPLLFIISKNNSAWGMTDKVIYGDDNRRSVTELDVDFDATIIDQSKAVLAQIPNWRISSSDSEFISIRTRTLQSGLKFCSEEKFLHAPIVSSCTAFLVGPDVIVTAGHCIKDKYDCKKNTWVLDYDTSGDFTPPIGDMTFAKDKTYACAELLAWSDNTNLDYAVIKLDRAVTDRSPLKLRRVGKVSDQESLLTIGHPLGTPKVVADNILIRDNKLTYVFKTNADTFSGNSGAPVIGSTSGLVEGILVRGEDDFKTDLDSGCERSIRCKNNDCRGESVQRSTYLPFKHIPKI